jgi:hypothetical protein
MDWIDLRSDTVTHPTEAMWQAMAVAEVGDDVFGEDPTINKLQAMAAEKMGKEAGLFVPSGTRHTHFYMKQAAYQRWGVSIPARSPTSRMAPYPSRISNLLFVQTMPISLSRGLWFWRTPIIVVVGYPCRQNIPGLWVS